MLPKNMKTQKVDPKIIFDPKVNLSKNLFNTKTLFNIYFYKFLFTYIGTQVLSCLQKNSVLYHKDALPLSLGCNQKLIWLHVLYILSPSLHPPTLSSTTKDAGWIILACKNYSKYTENM